MGIDPLLRPMVCELEIFLTPSINLSVRQILKLANKGYSEKAQHLILMLNTFYCQKIN
jgi:hypothetical protein